MKNRITFVLLLAAWVIGGCARPETVTYDIAAESSAEEITREAAQEETPAEPETVCVYICGAVKEPDVYDLPAGSRVCDAVAAAGGMTEAADDRALNLAELLSDGQQIIVYTREETEGGESAPAAAKDSGKVNLNSATKEQLMTLPGIGEVRAEAILSYREEHGRFTAIEEIREISGIGEKSFEKLKGSITI